MDRSALLPESAEGRIAMSPNIPISGRNLLQCKTRNGFEMTLLNLLAIHTLMTIPTTIDQKLDKTLLRSWLSETSQLIEQRYWNESEKVYIEEIDSAGKPSGQAAFMWDMGVVLAGYAQGMKVDRKTYAPLFEKALAAIEPYWSDARGLKGYSVLPRQSDPDRYYDDNAWIALALCEAYETTKNKKYLERAAETYKFVVSCEDSKVGGGLYWHEPERNGKNTCTNAPAINVALRLYRATKERRYLVDAMRLYEWVKCLQDTDGLYFDNIGISGKVEHMKWTYNSALMIRANCLFYEITKDQKYNEEARRVALAAFAKWYRPDPAALTDEASFAHHLFEAFYEVAAITKDQKWIERTSTALRFVHDSTRSSLGLYGHRWDTAPNTETDDFKLLFQASALRAYAIASAGN